MFIKYLVLKIKYIIYYLKLKKNSYLKNKEYCIEPFHFFFLYAFIHLLCIYEFLYINYVFAAATAAKSRQSCLTLCDPHRWQATRLPRPWDSPGKNTGVGCHFPLQCMKVKSESEVAPSCLTLCDPMDCSPPGSSIHRISQARVLEWGAIAFSGTVP